MARKICVVQYPNHTLMLRCQPVSLFDKTLHEKLDSAIATMNMMSGMGLAANQLGFIDRFFVMKDQRGRVQEFVNPKIVEAEGDANLPEGCLSAPGVFITVNRSNQVTVEAFDRYGEQFKVVCYGIEAVCVQHEIDHLDGIFFYQRMR